MAVFDVILVDPAEATVSYHLDQLPIPPVASPNAVLFLWASTAQKFKGFQLAAAWGFRYRTTVYWDTMEDQVHELLVCDRQGGPRLTGLPAIIRTPQPEGGGRPAEFRRMIERVTGKFSSRRCLEVFGLKPAAGWTTAGLPGSSVAADLRELYERGR